MGGNALKNVKVSRFNSEDYNQVKSEILTKLVDNGFECSVPHSRPGKTSFGDLDVLIKIRRDIDLFKWIKENFNPVEIFSNCVYSFAYPKENSDEYYQIDFIPVQSLDTAMFFFSYGDVGAIIGMYCSFNGLKFSYDSLGIKVNKHLLGYEKTVLIPLTHDLKEICNILELDLERWHTLSTVDEVFDWLMCSKYYSVEAYKFLPLQKRRRIRHKPMYQEFLSRIGVTEYDDIDKRIVKPIDYSFQEAMLKHFDKWDQVISLREQLKLEEERREKFNAKVFISFGMKGKDIGSSMSEFKKYIKGNFDEWLDSHNIEEIEETIKEFIQIKNLFK